MKIDIGEMTKQDWLEYVGLCGWALARAHARTGNPQQIAGYLGKNDAFGEAIAEFAVAYANQADRDYAMFVKAIRARKLPASSDAVV